MKRKTVSLSLVLGLGVVGFGALGGDAHVVGPRAAYAAPEEADPVAEWEKKFDRALKDAASGYTKLAKKYEEKLEATSAYTRRFTLRYTPDDEETRKYLGYEKARDPNGPKWERSDIRRDQINEFSDLEDPNATKYKKDKAELEKKIVAEFGRLAKSAPDAERAKRAWERVLEVEDVPGNKAAEEAHKALNHPKFQGKYCSPIKFKYVQARNDRQQAGMKQANAKISPIDPVECDGVFVQAGFTGGGAKSTHFVFNSTHGKEVAMRLAGSAEKALNDIVATYGFPETIRDRVSMKFNSLKSSSDHEEFKKLMEKGFGWKPAQILKYAEIGLTGVSEGGERVDPSSGGVDGDDSAASVTALNVQHIASSLAKADLGSSSTDPLEDWLKQSICYDVTQRVFGTRLTIYGDFGRYGQGVEARPGEDKWVELARRLVQTDDDIPLKQFPKFKISSQDFKGPQIVKGWAFIQFVFEKDPERAKKFIWHALADGTAAATAAIYPDNPDDPDPEKSMALLDAEYREWILKAW